ncbi:MAG: PilC/PilY family type IV pilus protein, partial [Candidatus Nitrosopolaris sp.]
SRGAATPIFYDLTITQNGLLSLSYSLNSGSSYQPVISAVPITSSNGSLPADFLFGFAGSTGGSSNIHEILCFKAAPNTTSASSAGASQRQSAQYETGELAYFAYYNPGNWTGTVTASKLGIGPDNNIVVASTPSWDAGCVLTGVSSTTTTCATTGLALQNAVPTPANRAVLSWNGSTGVPFEWNNMTTAQQNLLDNGDSTLYAGNPVWSALGANADPARLNFLRGDRTNEIVSTASGPSGLFRARTDLIADIVDSSPTWVGPPLASFPGTWLDRLYTTASPGENTTGAESYSTYAGASGQGGRLNVVYIGSNDGLVHGFRSGTFNAATGVYTAAGTVPNDGQEVLAYMPAAVVQTIHQYAASPPATASADADVDYSNTQYEHNFFVDATPGTGDLFYGNQWHTWLVGGLGPGGSALYALDVSDPTQFSEGHASSLVVGEWTPSSISCTNVGSCGSSMGQTYGTPAIRRLHDGNWGVIFGNGYGSATGDAGIYVMIIPSSSTGVPSPTIYYLSTSTGSASSPNGIAYTAAADLDGDHITDYVYAGDLQGNIWRFDLTSQTEANWKVSPGPLFKTPSGQPVTTNLVVASGTPAGSNQQYLMVMFGTGQKTPMTQSSAATYSSGTQSLYGVWDWNLSASDGGEDGPGSGHPQGWDGVSGAQYASLTQANTGLSSPYTLSQSNLLQQVVTLNPIQITVGTTTTTYYNRDISSNANVCWKGTSTSGCSVNNQFGWYLNLPGTQEQIVFNPELVQQALTVNSIVPAQLDATSCTIPTDTGYTYVLNAMSGGKFNEVFLPSNEASDSTFNTDPRYTDANAIGMQTNATGSSFITGNSAGTMYLVYETNSVPTGSGSIGSGSIGLNLPTNTTAKPLGWIERR